MTPALTSPPSTGDLRDLRLHRLAQVCDCHHLILAFIAHPMVVSRHPCQVRYDESDDPANDLAQLVNVTDRHRRCTMCDLFCVTFYDVTLFDDVNIPIMGPNISWCDNK